jgi:hypothetical protein
MFGWLVDTEKSKEEEDLKRCYPETWKKKQEADRFGCLIVIIMAIIIIFMLSH